MEFRQFLELRNRRHQVRNLDLLNQIEKGNSEQLKKEIGANAFGVLKKRLKDALLDFIGTRKAVQQTKEEQELSKWIQLGKHCLDFGYPKEGLTYLLKAEGLALELDQFWYLNEIYHLLIEH
ncbi:MAG: hypothetical protein KDC84_06650 [Crocinitomicaceae bacterium]|nr:hypothetical protein [Crocinitomicaceae bacterium]